MIVKDRLCRGKKYYKRDEEYAFCRKNVTVIFPGRARAFPDFFPVARQPGNRIFHGLHKPVLISLNSGT